MTDPQDYWKLEKECYTITSPSDLTLRVVEYHEITALEGTITVWKSVAKKIHEFKVDLATLALSERFNRILEQEPDDVGLIEIDEDDPGMVTGLATWLKIIHYLVTEDTYELHLYQVWYVCSVAQKYGFSMEADKAKEWFDSWYNHQPQIKHFNYRDYEQLVYPTWAFNHAVGFSHTTKYLAYRSNGLINEEKPEDFRAKNADDIFTSYEVMHQLNAARNRLTTVLHRALYGPISKMLNEVGCDNTPFVLFSYEKALTHTGCWPLHPALEKTSIKAVLDELMSFSRTPVQTCRNPMCPCSLDLTAIVDAAVKDIEGQFAGLCLDCMDHSSEPGLEHKYWAREPFGTAWDDGCRVCHTQPSWFFSFMGKRSKMNEYLLKKSQSANSYGRQHQSSYGYGNNAFPRGGAVGRGGSTRGGGGTRGGVRNSQRPGRQDSLLSRPYYANNSYAVQDVTNQLANTTISGFPHQHQHFTFPQHR